LSEAGAWQSLDKLRGITLLPGDKILLKSGSIWNNVNITPTASGEPGNPIRIDKYGEGSKPILNGNGNTNAVIRLDDVQYWEISNLEITNDNDFNVDENASNVFRRGILVIARTKVISYIRITGCYIHNVDAYNEDKDSGGIIGRIEGTNPDLYFNDIRLENNRIEKVDRTGINFGFNSVNGNYSRGNRNNSKVVIQNNYFSDIGGDGIIVIGCNAPLIQFNIFERCRARTTGPAVAVFPWQCNDAVFQYNEAYGTKADRPDQDGQAFDCDYGNNGTTFQFNYSHDNQGGFMLLCSPGDASPYQRNYNSIVRYNISQNDGMRVFRLVGPGTRFSNIYNNSVYLGADVVGDVVKNESWNGLAGEARFENNIFYIEPNAGGTRAFDQNPEIYYDNNAYFGVAGPNSDQHKITGDPLFADAGGAGIGMATGAAYKLTSGSPCIDSGKLIVGNDAMYDFFGNPLYNGLPDIGASEYSTGAYTPAPALKQHLANAGFESGNLDFWDNMDSVAVSTEAGISGEYGAEIGSKGRIQQLARELKPNTSYTLIVWGRVNNPNIPLKISVEGYGGSNKQALLASQFNDQALITFTTGAENTTAVIKAYYDTTDTGARAYLDNVQIVESRAPLPEDIETRELVRNGGFESGLERWGYLNDNQRGPFEITGDAQAGSYGLRVRGNNTLVGQTVTGMLPNVQYRLTFWAKVDEGVAKNKVWIGIQNPGQGYDAAVTPAVYSYKQYNIPFTITKPGKTDATVFIYNGDTVTGAVYIDNFSIIGPTTQIQVKNITVTGANGASTITTRGGTLQLSAQIDPDNAANKAVTWSVENKTGSAEISATGVLTAVSDGEVTVKATAQDGSGAAGTLAVSISGQKTIEASDRGIYLNIPPSTPAAHVAEGKIEVEVKAGTDGAAKAEVAASDFDAAVNSSGDNSVVIQVKTEKGTKSIEVVLPAQRIAAIEEKQVKTIAVHTNFAAVYIDLSVLKGGMNQNSAKVVLSIAEVNKAELGAEVRARIGNNKVYDFILSVDEVKIGGFNNKEKALVVEMEYVLEKGQNPNHIVAYFINEKGHLEVIKNSRYDAASGKLRFNLSHFSKYAGANADVSFVDMDGINWAEESIQALVAREIVNGTGNGNFNPMADITRAEFIQMLLKAFDLINKDAESTFNDVTKGNWYYAPVASAEKLGITSGKAMGYFGANDSISREELSVLAYRMIKLLEVQLPGQAAEAFADGSEISGYAREAVAAMKEAGIIQGVGSDRFAPKAMANRAQAAVIIYRLFNLYYK
jgi:hypothetical protein